MADGKQIIVDGIDVSKCSYIISNNPPLGQGTWGGAIHKGACKVYSKDCKYNPNCLFKQLARKTQIIDEMEEIIKPYQEQIELDALSLPIAIESILERKTQECEELKDYAQRQENQRETYYKEFVKKDKTLEEIENIVKDFTVRGLCFYNDIDDIIDCSHCDMNTDCNYLRKVKILDLIYKAKGDKNEYKRSKNTRKNI